MKGRIAGRQMDKEVWSEALKGATAPGGRGRMSPGTRRWGFSGYDGSTLKSSIVPFPPDCALFSPISLFPYPLSLAPLCVLSLHPTWV